jgi:4-azaleucine resistance transporter AzlC
MRELRTRRVERREAIRWGLSNGLPIALGYLPVALTFGILGRQAGLTVGAVTGMSAWVYAGASQFLAVKMIASGLGSVQIILATLILNFRHFLMSTVLSRRIEGSKRGTALLSYWVTDETFVVATVHARPEGLSATGFFVMAIMAYLAWVSGGFLGGVFAELIPVRIVDGMGIGLYALFIALLVPSARKHWQFALVAAATALCAWGLSCLAPGLSEGWTLIVATLGVSAAGTLLPDVESEN